MAHIHSIAPLSLDDNAAILRARHPTLDNDQLNAIMAVVRAPCPSCPYPSSSPSVVDACLFTIYLPRIASLLPCDHGGGAWLF